MEHLTSDLAAESGILTEAQALAWIKEQGMSVKIDVNILDRT
jgi:hypothetical protein